MGLKMFDLPPDGIQDGAVAKLDKEQSTSTEVKPQIVTEQVSPDDPIKKKVKMPDGATYPEGSEEYDRIVKEHKLEKGCGYHLDLFIVAVLIVVCSIFGLPWFVAATVLSINHVRSLTRESETAAPGENRYREKPTATLANRKQSH